MKAKFRPHSLDPAALEATATTLESLHRAGKITRDDDGGILVKDGWIEMTGGDLKFVIWAAVRQGYVEAAE